MVFPYGNGAERTLENRNVGASLYNLNFNIHHKAHVLRAAQEGIVFALNYGFDIMRQVGVKARTVRAGCGNLFLSRLFSQAFATVTGATLELYNTEGCQGAARGAGVGSGLYGSIEEAFVGLDCQKTIEPDPATHDAYQEAYEVWLNRLDARMSTT